MTPDEAATSKPDKPHIYWGNSEDFKSFASADVYQRPSGQFAARIDYGILLFMREHPTWLEQKR